MTTETARPFTRLLDRLRETGGLKGTDIANLAGVPAATVSRWETGRKSPSPKAQFLVSDLAYVMMRLGGYYGSDEIRAWLYTRHPQLDGKRAIDLIRDDCTKDVLAILERIDADAYL